MNILLVEDEKINAMLAKRLLEKRSHSVEHVSSGEDAVTQASENQYDVIFMDVQMPGIDGLEATRRIRKKEEATGSHVPIIAMTAYALEDDRERCLAAGMDNYVPKPLEIDKLEALLQELQAQKD